MEYPLGCADEDAIRALDASDCARDVRICGMSLAVDRESAYAERGAHDPTAARYFILEDVFGKLGLDDASRVLDVGCGMGRALAYFVDAGFPGTMTGIELDGALADTARSWTCNHENLKVVSGDVLELSLEEFTHFYLFNPFDSPVLQKLIEKIEREAKGPVRVLHTSDNGETYYYYGRDGWVQEAQGAHRLHEGIPVFGCPQHWSLWSFIPRSPRARIAV